MCHICERLTPPHGMAVCNHQVDGQGSGFNERTKQDSRLFDWPLGPLAEACTCTNTRVNTRVQVGLVKRDWEDTGQGSNSKMTGSGSASCSNARNFPFHTRYILDGDPQRGGIINSRFPPAPSIDLSCVTW